MRISKDLHLRELALVAYYKMAEADFKQGQFIYESVI